MAIILSRLNENNNILQYFSSEQILNQFKELIGDSDYALWLKDTEKLGLDIKQNKSIEEVVLNKLSTSEIIENIDNYDIDIYNKLIKNLKEILNNEID